MLSYLLGEPVAPQNHLFLRNKACVPRYHRIQAGGDTHTHTQHTENPSASGYTHGFYQSCFAFCTFFVRQNGIQKMKTMMHIETNSLVGIFYQHPWKLTSSQRGALANQNTHLSHLRSCSRHKRSAPLQTTLLEEGYACSVWIAFDEHWSVFYRVHTSPKEP